MKRLMSCAWVLALLLVSACVSHVCIFSPMQRGGTPEVLLPGSPQCYRRTPYCGGADPEAPVMSYEAGSTAVLHLQQNLNHWYPQKPGYFDIAVAPISSTSESDFVVLKRWSDWVAHDMVTQTNFTMHVVMPPTPCEHCVLRFRYVSHNPLEIDPANNTDSIFYNCADIRITPASTPVDVPPPAVAPSHEVPVTEHDCEAPLQFTANATEYSAFGTVDHYIVYDAVSQHVRWTRTNAFWSGAKVIDTLSVYGASPNPLEYVLVDGKCAIYGPDHFYPWSFGSTAGMTYGGEIKVEGEDAIIWTMDGPIEFVSRKSDCTPLMVVRTASPLVRTLRFTHIVPTVDTSAFVVPAQCHKAALPLPHHCGAPSIWTA